MMSRTALRRVVQSLLASERASARHTHGAPQARDNRLPAIWPDRLRLAEDGEVSLGCDLLERLQLAAAANEMFHLYETGDEANLLAMETLRRLARPHCAIDQPRGRMRDLPDLRLDGRAEALLPRRRLSQARSQGFGRALLRPAAPHRHGPGPSHLRLHLHGLAGR